MKHFKMHANNVWIEQVKFLLVLFMMMYLESFH